MCICFISIVEHFVPLVVTLKIIVVSFGFLVVFLEVLSLSDSSSFLGCHTKRSQGWLDRAAGLDVGVLGCLGWVVFCLVYGVRIF